MMTRVFACVQRMTLFCMWFGMTNWIWSRVIAFDDEAI